MFCNSPLPQGKIHFRDLCIDCGRELHICRHCFFYKPGLYRDCAETVPDEVRDKERMNFCEYFRPAWKPQAGGKKPSASDAARDAFSGLFGS